VSILHVEPFENRGGESLLATTDAGAGAVLFAVDINGEELACRAEIGDCILSREPGLNFDRSFDCVFWVQHRDVIDV